MNQQVRRVGWGVARGVFGLALLAWVLGRVGLDLGQLARNAEWVVPFAAFPFFGAAVEASRLRLLLRSLHIDLRFAGTYRMVLAAFAFSLCLPGSTGGDLLKLYWLGGQQAGRRVEIAALIFLDRALGMLGLMLAGGVLSVIEIQQVMANSPLTLLATVIGSLAALGIAAISLGPLLASPVAALLRRVPGIGPPAARAIRMLVVLRAQGHALALGILLSFVAQAVLLSCYALAARAVLGRDSLTLNALLASFGLFANLIPFTPGGMGVGEAAFEHLFRLAGGGGGGAMISVIGRVGSIPAFAVGLALYVAGVHRARNWATRAGSETGVGSPGAGPLPDSVHVEPRNSI